MVKRGLFFLALLLAVAGLRAAFLPFQLDPPKHDNPVDPLSPQGLARLAAALTPVAPFSATPTPVQSPTTTPSATPTPTPVLPQVIDELPLSGGTVNIPFVSAPVTVANAGNWELTLRFNMDMDTTTYTAPGAVVFTPPADLLLLASTARSATYLLTTTNNGGIHPLAVSTAYSVTVSNAIHAATGVPLQPATLSYSTGPFRLATLLTGNPAGSGDGMFYPSVVNTNASTWPDALCAVFNAPLDTSVTLGSQVQTSPTNVVSALQWGNSGIKSDVNSIGLNVCGAVPNTSYTFAYSGGIKDQKGNVAPALGGLTRTSDPLRVVGWNTPPATKFLLVNFNYPLDIATGNAGTTVLPSAPAPITYVNNACAPGSNQAPGIFYVYNGGPTFPPGVTYTATVAATVADIGDTTTLGTPWTVTFYVP